MPSTVPIVLSTTDREWLKNFQNIPGERKAPNLSQADVDHLYALVCSHSLVCELVAWVYGFALDIFEQPNTSKKQLKHIVRITQLQFPVGGKVVDSPEETLYVKNLASRFTHTPQNAELLRLYGRRPQQDPIDYLY